LTSESKEQRPMIDKERIEQRYRFEYLDQSRWQLGDQSGKLSTQPQLCQIDDVNFGQIIAIFNRVGADANIGCLSWPFIGKAYIAQLDQARADEYWSECSPILRSLGFQSFWVAGRGGLADLIEHITTYLSFDSENYVWQPRRPEIRIFADALSKLEGHWEPFLSPNQILPVTPSPANLIAASEEIDLGNWFELSSQIPKRRKGSEQSKELHGVSIVQSYGESRWSDDESAKPCIFIVKALQVWHVPALFYFGGHGQCPPPQIHCAMLKHWQEKYLVDLYGISKNSLEMSSNIRNSKDVEQLLREIEIYCPGSAVSTVISSGNSKAIIHLKWIGS